MNNAVEIVHMNMPTPPEGWEYCRRGKAETDEKFLCWDDEFMDGPSEGSYPILRRVLKVGDYVEHCWGGIRQVVNLHVDKVPWAIDVRVPDGNVGWDNKGNLTYLDPAEGKKRWDKEVAKPKPSEIDKFIGSLERAIKTYKDTPS